MKIIAEKLWTEPVLILAIVPGVTAALAAKGVIAPWIPLVVLAIVTPIQRILVRPKPKRERG